MSSTFAINEGHLTDFSAGRGSQASVILHTFALGFHDLSVRRGIAGRTNSPWAVLCEHIALMIT
jgi:hypothetical protein